MSNTLEELGQQTFDDVPSETNIKPGTYLFQVMRAKVDQTDKDEPKGYIELTMRPLEVIEGDLNADDLPNVYPVKDSLWLSEKARKFTKRTLELSFGLELEGKSYFEIAEALIGANVIGTTTLEDFKLRNGDVGQRVKITRYRAVN